jgi:hypothetical protein
MAMPTLDFSQQTPALISRNDPSQAQPQAMARGGVIPPSETHVHIHPGQVVSGPQMGKVGTKDQATAVVPLHDDGSPKTEAMQPEVAALLKRPDFMSALADVVSKAKQPHHVLAEAMAARGKG